MDRSVMVKNKLKQIGRDIAVMLLVNLSATSLSILVRHIGLSEANIVVIYVFSALFISRYTKGYVCGIIASFISMLSFNFFFIKPLYTLRVYDQNYMFTFVIMLFAAIFTSTLTSKLIRLKELASERERQARILNSITSTLAKTGGMHEVAAVAAQCLADLLKCDITFIVILPKSVVAQKLRVEKSSHAITASDLNFNEIALVIKEFTNFPIKVEDRIIGHICLPKDIKAEEPDNMHLLDSVILQITISMERELLTGEKETAKADIAREKFKSNLLRAISHDLRTPLAGITGSAEMLLQNLKEEENIRIAQGIYEDSCWLTLLVENVLSLTKIQEGRLSLCIKSEAVEEIVSEAVSRAARYTPNHKISTFVPADVLFVPMDGKLIEQVLINLIDNAMKHTSADDEIKISVHQDHHKVWFTVSNSGTGIDEEDLPKIFDMFSVPSRSHTDGKRGIGIGLAICKSIVNYHGGEIFAGNNPGGGMTFRFFLNIKEEGIWDCY